MNQYTFLYTALVLSQTAHFVSHVCLTGFNKQPSWIANYESELYTALVVTTW